MNPNQLKPLLLMLLAVALCGGVGCKPEPRQKMQAEIVAVYQGEDGLWETVLHCEDDTRIIWHDRKMGKVGDKFTIWKGIKTSSLQDPNAK